MNSLLAQHLKDLKSAGHTVDSTPDGGTGEQSRYFVVFKDYTIPEHIWGRETVDLLIIVPGVYPNAKLDMFWVDPKLTLDGGLPEAANNDEPYLGRMWQRFSWHPSAWNPARDTIITYLEFVNHRLHQRR